MLKMQVPLQQPLPINVNRNLRFSNWSADALSAPVTPILNLPIPPKQSISTTPDSSRFGVPPLGGSAMFCFGSSSDSCNSVIGINALPQQSTNSLIHPSTFGVPPLGGPRHLSLPPSINPTIHQSTALRPAPRLIDFGLPRLHVATRVVT